MKADWKEIRVFGPPGTGKTTKLTSMISRAVSILGPEAVVVSSFTKAAAVEIAGRGLPLPKGHIGTLHSLCFHALGCPKITQSKELLKEWNARSSTSDQMKVEGEVNTDDFEIEEKDPDLGNLFLAYQQARARIIPRKLWNMELQRFAAKWEAFKEETDSMDFTDLIEEALKHEVGLPQGVEVGFFDEVQDFSPLELSLVRSWARWLDRVVLAGDDDQAIYLFKGAIPQAFLEPPIPEDQKIVLGQSYRLPVTVKEYADRWIQQVRGTREKKDFKPREEPPGSGIHAKGAVGELPFGYDQPEEIVGEASSQAGKGKSVMLLATCGYMLDQIIRELKNNGVLFHNPYRTKNGKWNPMRGGIDRVRDLLRPDVETWGEEARPWTWSELWHWLEFVDAKKSGMIHGMKKYVENLAKRADTREEIVNQASFNGLFNGGREKETLRAFGGDPLAWFRSSILEGKKPLVDYALNVATLGGKKRLMEKPKIIVGTIHSVKGGQADVVNVFPDLSMAGNHNWTEGTQEEIDSILRVFYVGFTRARERLELCYPMRGWRGRRQAVEF